MGTGTLEQNLAAGTQSRREIRLESGKVVVVSVAVRTFPASHRQRYAYLQFKEGNKTTTKYIGRVTAESKEESLSLGWKLLRQRKLVEENGWAWVARRSK